MEVGNTRSRHLVFVGVLCRGRRETVHLWRWKSRIETVVDETSGVKGSKSVTDRGSRRVTGHL